jgi:hypothetical protein
VVRLSASLSEQEDIIVGRLQSLVDAIAHDGERAD